MATEPETIVADRASLFHKWTSKFIVDRIEIQTEHREWPGGDEGNMAHVHAEDDLRSFTIEHNFLGEDAIQQRCAVIHELLHIAFRHVGSVRKYTVDPTAKAWLTQALEEDTEALAVAIERWIDL